MEKQLQRKIFNFALLGLLITCLLIMVASIIPLHQQLKSQNNDNLLFAIKIRTMLAEEYFEKIFETSMLITSRSKMRQTLVEYNQNSISISDYQNQTTEKMKDVLDKSKIISGVYRFNIQGEQVNHVGVDIPKEYLRLDSLPKKEAILTGIWSSGKNTFVITAAPILNREEKFVGHDIVVFETLSLENMVREYDGLGRTGETILFAPNQNKGFSPVFGLREQPTGMAQKEPLSLELSFLNSQKSLEPIVLEKNTIIFDRLKNVDWVIVVRIDKQELDYSIFQKLTPVIVLILLIIPISLSGLFLILKPLIQRLEEQMVSLEQEILARKQAEEFSDQEKERLSVTIQSLGEGVITTDLDGKIILMNGIAETLTGWKQQDAAGKSLQDILLLFDEKTGKSVSRLIFQSAWSKEPFDDIDQVSLQSKDHSQYLIEISCDPIFTNDSEPIGSVLVFRDITQEIEIKEDLFKIKKLQSVGILAGGLAHDFNNILVAILGNIDLAASKIEESHPIYPILIRVKKATVRAKNITLQLLTFSKGGSPIKQTSSMKEIIIDSAEFVLHGSSVKCTYDIPDDLWLVDVDVGQMGQVIQNIIINGRDAMPQGGKFTISCSNVAGIQDDKIPPQKGSYIKLVIEDNGSGIEKTHLEQIFDPYFSTKEHGSGLGLAVCHSIIQKHNGFITVSSVLDVGTIFTIYIPAEKDSHSLELSVEISQPISLPDTTIMVMDDEEAIRDMLNDALTHLGFQVVLVRNGLEAITTYKEYLSAGHNIDLIIMDLTIPGSLGGKETAPKLLEINPDVKLVVFSGYFNDPVMANAENHGFVASLPKPFTLLELKRVLHSVLAED